MRRTVFILSFLVFIQFLHVNSTDLTAPDYFQVQFGTTVQGVGDGSFTVEVKREWAPLGVDHFYTLLQPSVYYYDNNGFFRVIENFVVQWGINGNPNVTAEWDTPIPDDPVLKSNLRGWMTYATAGPNTRTTQLYINYANNSYLDDQGFAPFAYVISGMDVVDSIYSGYAGEPIQALITREGNSYLEANFPLLDYITTARITPITTVVGGEVSSNQSSDSVNLLAILIPTILIGGLIVLLCAVVAIILLVVIRKRKLSVEKI